MVEIVDGTGNGNRAEVNEFNQISCISESLSSEGINARRGGAFIIHAKCHTSAASSGAFINIVNNTQGYDMEISRIYIDPHTITPTNLIITQVMGATISNGTDVSSTAVIQKNGGEADVFDLGVTISDSASDMTYTGGIEYHSFPIKTMTSTQRNMSQTNIIPKGKSILFGWETVDGSNATDGEIVSFSINIVKV